MANVRHLKIFSANIFLVFSIAIPCESQGISAQKLGIDANSRLATARAYDKALPVRPEIATKEFRTLREEPLPPGAPSWVSNEVTVTPGSPIGEPAFSLRPNEDVEVLDIFPNDGESKYTCLIVSQERESGFVYCSDVKLTEWHGERGALASIIFSEPYEYESSYLDRKESIEKLSKFIDDNPASRFAPFAELTITLMNCYVATEAVQDVWGDLRELREAGLGQRRGIRIGARWTSEASQLYSALSRKEDSRLKEVLDLCDLVKKLRDSVLSPIGDVSNRN